MGGILTGSLIGNLIGSLIGSCQLDRQSDRHVSSWLLEGENAKQLACRRLQISVPAQTGAHTINNKSDYMFYLLGQMFKQLLNCCSDADAECLPTAGALCLLLFPFTYCWCPLPAADALCLLQVPFAYCWSEALVPKPADWGAHIDVVGYCFLNEGSHMNYRPPQQLKEFLAAGKPPVYIGFGSLIVDDAEKLTRIILEAAKETNQRVLLSRYGTNKQPLGLQCVTCTAAAASWACSQ